MKVKMEENVADFIKSYSGMTVMREPLDEIEKLINPEGKQKTVYWINSFFLETNDPTVFEILNTDDILVDVIQKRLSEEDDNSDED